MSHYDASHSSPMYTCIKCNLSVENQTKFLNHFEVCEETCKIEICDFCPFIFNPAHPLENFNHIKSHLLTADTGTPASAITSMPGMNIQISS